MTAAMLLARQGHRITLVDRDPGPEADRPWERRRRDAVPPPALAARSRADAAGAAAARRARRAGRRRRRGPDGPRDAGSHGRDARTTLGARAGHLGVHLPRARRPPPDRPRRRDRRGRPPGARPRRRRDLRAGGPRRRRERPRRSPRRGAPPAQRGRHRRAWPTRPASTSCSPARPPARPTAARADQGARRLHAARLHPRPRHLQPAARAGATTTPSSPSCATSTSSRPPSRRCRSRRRGPTPLGPGPIDQVRAGSGLVNSYQGQPTALGFLAIGDAFCTTNPAGLAWPQPRHDGGRRAGRHRGHAGAPSSGRPRSTTGAPPTSVRGSRSTSSPTPGCATPGRSTPTDPEPADPVEPRGRRGRGRTPEWMRLLGPFLGMAAMSREHRPAARAGPGDAPRRLASGPTRRHHPRRAGRGAIASWRDLTSPV